MIDDGGDGDDTLTTFPVVLSYKGKSITIPRVSSTVTIYELYETIIDTLQLRDDTNENKCKILYKGKKLNYDHEIDKAKCVFSSASFQKKMMSSKAKPPKILVMTSSITSLHQLNSQKSDPLMRNFEQEKQREESRTGVNYHSHGGNNKKKPSEIISKVWGEHFVQDKNYKFCRFEACTWQSFGHSSQTPQQTASSIPHDFEALELLHQLATDPGIVAIMKERELVVNTLGEMDPIDDTIMKKKQTEGGGQMCLLGYNSNHGLRIDLKLRNEKYHFRSYSSLISTLIHELSHNWIGDHNLLFWTNFAQMRIEYIYTHAVLRSTSYIINGKSNTELAQLSLPPPTANNNLEQLVFQFIMHELKQEMAQHGLHPNMIISPIQQRLSELEKNRVMKHNGRTMMNSGSSGSGGDGDGRKKSSSPLNTMSARELALMAAEERRTRQQQQQEQQHHHQNAEPKKNSNDSPSCHCCKRC